jgi:hypothetical protein
LSIRAKKSSHSFFGANHSGDSGVTRGKRLVVLVGQRQALAILP